MTDILIFRLMLYNVDLILYILISKTIPSFFSIMLKIRLVPAFSLLSRTNIFHHAENLPAPFDNTILTFHVPLSVMHLTSSPAIHSRPRWVMLIGISCIGVYVIKKLLHLYKLYYTILRQFYKTLPLRVIVCQHSNPAASL